MHPVQHVNQLNQHVPHHHKHTNNHKLLHISAARMLSPDSTPRYSHPIIIILAILYILCHVYWFNIDEYDFVYDTNSVLLCEKKYEFYVNAASKNFRDSRNEPTLSLTTNTTPETSQASHPTPCLSRKLREFYNVYDIFDIFYNNALNNTLRFGM